MGRLVCLSCVVVAFLVSGCAMCCSPYDEAYGYTGGRWQRTDLCSGRVGSAFAPAGGQSGVIVDESISEPLPVPTKPEKPQAPMKSVKKLKTDWSGDLMTEE